MNMTLSAYATVSLALAMQLVCLAMAEPQQQQQQQQQQHRQQSGRRQSRTPQAQVIRSVNPVATDKSPLASPPVDPARVLDLASLIRQQVAHNNNNNNSQNSKYAIHLDKRSSQEQRTHRSREQMMHLLLQELPQLDIEALNGPHRQRETNSDVNEQQQQQQQQLEATSLANMLSAAGNRLRGRAAFSSAASSQVTAGSPQPTAGPAHFRGFDLEGGAAAGFQPTAANGMKRTPNRHAPTPCGFFNAITCF